LFAGGRGSVFGGQAQAAWRTPALCPQRRLRRSPLAAASGRFHHAV